MIKENTCMSFKDISILALVAILFNIAESIVQFW